MTGLERALDNRVARLATFRVWCLGWRGKCGWSAQRRAETELAATLRTCPLCDSPVGTRPR